MSSSSTVVLLSLPDEKNVVAMQLPAPLPAHFSKEEKPPKGFKRVWSQESMASLTPPRPQKSIFLLGALMQSLFGYYFAYDAVGILGPYLKDQYGITTQQISIFYSCQSLPLMMLVFGMGSFMDRFGPHKALIFGTAGTTLGMVVVSCLPSYTGLIIGGTIYGVGMSPMWVSASSLLQTWFVDKNSKRKVTVTFGVTVFWIRTASISSYYILPEVAEKAGLAAALWCVTGVTFLSLVSSVIFGFVDWMLYGETSANKTGCAANCFGTKVVTIDDPSLKKTQSSEDTKRKPAFSAQGILDALKSLWNFFRNLPFAFWLIVILETSSKGATWTYGSFGTIFLREYWDYSPASAARVTSLVAIVDAVSTPLVSFVIAYTGKRAYYLMGACGIMLVVSILYTGFLVPAELIFATVGFAQSIFDTNLYPCVPLLVPSNLLGKSNALVVMGLSIGLIVQPQLISTGEDLGGYFWAGAVYVLICAVGMVCAVVLKIYDWKKMDNLLDSMTHPEPVPTPLIQPDVLIVKDLENQ